MMTIPNHRVETVEAELREYLQLCVRNVQLDVENSAVVPFPPKKECIILTHPGPNSLHKTNNANIECNKGVVAGQKASEARCPKLFLIFVLCVITHVE